MKQVTKNLIGATVGARVASLGLFGADKHTED